MIKEKKNKIHQLNLKNKSNMLAIKLETLKTSYMKPWRAAKESTTKTYWSLLCSVAKKRIIYDNVLKYFLDSNLIFLKISGFRPGDTLTSVNHL